MYGMPRALARSLISSRRRGETAKRIRASFFRFRNGDASVSSSLPVAATFRTPTSSSSRLETISLKIKVGIAGVRRHARHAVAEQGAERRAGLDPGVPLSRFD